MKLGQLIDKVLYKGNFHKEYAEIVQHKQVPDLHLILLSCPKYSHCINSFVKRFKRLSKIFKKSNFSFLKKTQFLFMDPATKSKKGPSN